MTRSLEYAILNAIFNTKYKFFMVHEIFSHYAASVSDLKKQPMSVVNAANGEALAILNHNEPVFYCVPRDLYEAMMEALDDAYLVQLVKEREGEEAIEVSIENL